LSFYLNGAAKTVRGEAGRAAVIKVNGKPAGLESTVNFGDEIIVVDAKDGDDARVFVGDLAPRVDVGTVVCEGVEYYIAPRAKINKAVCALGAEVREGDRVELSVQTTVKMFVNDYLRERPGSSYAVNGVKVGGDHVLTPGDELTIVNDGKHMFVVNGETVEMQSGTPELLLVDLFNYIKIDQSSKKGRLYLEINGVPARLTDPVKTGDKIIIKWDGENRR